MNMSITQSSTYSAINVEVPENQNDYKNYTTIFFDNNLLWYNISNVSTDMPHCSLNLERRNLTIMIIISTIFCLSVTGNCLVILTILQNRWMRTVTNFLLLNLAISDLILTIICMPPTLTGHLFQCFFAGPFMCKIVGYMQPVSVAACSFTLVVIAMERYKAICQPLHSRHWKTKSHALTMIFVVWTLAFLCSIPMAVTTILIEYDTGKFNCLPGGRDAKTAAIFYGFLTAALFGIPLAVMVILYSLVIKTLWKGMQLDVQSNRELSSELHSGQKPSPTDDIAVGKSSNLIRNLGNSVRDRSKSSLNVLTNRKCSTAVVQSPSSVTSSSSASALPPTVNVIKLSKSSKKSRKKDTVFDPLALRSTHAERTLLAKKRVIKMLAAIVIEFFVCWMPLYTLILYSAIRSTQGSSTSYPKDFHVAFLILAYLSSCTNPVTYCFLNVKFRHALLITIGCRFMVKNSTQYSNASVYHPSSMMMPKRSCDERTNGVIDGAYKTHASKFGSVNVLTSTSRNGSSNVLSKMLPTIQSTDTFNSEKNFLSAPKSAHTEDSLLDEDCPTTRTTVDNPHSDDSVHIEKVTTM